MLQLNLDGRLGKDSEVKTSAKGKQYIRFSLANTTYIKGEEKTTWYDVTCFDPNIINQAEYLTKGKYVFVSGLYDCEAAVKNGQIYLNQSILAQTINYLGGGKKDGENTNTQNNEDDYKITTNYKPQTQTVQEKEKIEQSNSTSTTTDIYAYGSNDDDGDDLPF